LASGKGNCWDAWSPSGAFRQTPKRSKLYEECGTEQQKGGPKAYRQNSIAKPLISKAAEQSLPFFKVLRANSTFHWGPEQQQAFDDLKKYLEDTAVMTKPSPKAELLMHIAATDTAVSAILVEERKEADALKQFPIYYVSEALSSSKLFYSEMENMAYVVVMAKRKLRHYFQSHNVSVPTAFPLRDMFENKESMGRMGKWATELAEHVINFVARSAIKSQVLVDFVADWTPSAPKGEAIVTEPVWEVQCDGAYCHLGQRQQQS
jgi:hypothetical protein